MIAGGGVFVSVWPLFMAPIHAHQEHMKDYVSVRRSTCDGYTT